MPQDVKLIMLHISSCLFAIRRYIKYIPGKCCFTYNVNCLINHYCCLFVVYFHDVTACLWVYFRHHPDFKSCSSWIQTCFFAHSASRLTQTHYAVSLRRAVLFGQCLAIYPALCLRAPRRSGQKWILIAGTVHCWLVEACRRLQDLLVTA